MADYMTLLGAENVERAAHQMTNAAHTMQMAADSIRESNDRQREFLWEWLEALKAALIEAPDA